MLIIAEDLDNNNDLLFFNLRLNNGKLQLMRQGLIKGKPSTEADIKYPIKDLIVNFSGKLRNSD